MNTEDKNWNIVILDDYFVDQKAARETIEEIMCMFPSLTLLKIIGGSKEFDDFLQTYNGDRNKVAFWIDGDLNNESQQHSWNSINPLDQASDEVRNKDGNRAVERIKTLWGGSEYVIIGRPGSGKITGADYQSLKMNVLTQS